jgi:hypothetical protein
MFVEPWRFWIGWAVLGSVMVGSLGACTAQPAGKVGSWWFNQKWETRSDD